MDIAFLYENMVTPQYNSAKIRGEVIFENEKIIVKVKDIIQQEENIEASREEVNFYELSGHSKEKIESFAKKEVEHNYNST